MLFRKKTSTAPLRRDVARLEARREVLVDGAAGESGGQVLRTALALSLATGEPFRIDNIRAGRARPGLLRQHLAAVSAAAEVGGARVSGAEHGATSLSFAPTGVRPGAYHFGLGTAGGATLVAQTVLPALLLADRPSTLTFEGSTHDPLAPSWEFFSQSYLPALRRTGAQVTAELSGYGFWPAGGGRFTLSVLPCRALAPFELLERGSLLAKRAKAIVVSMPTNAAAKTLEEMRHKLGISWAACRLEEVRAPSPGNVVMIEVQSEQVTEVFTGFGRRGEASDEVAEKTRLAVHEYIGAGVPVGRHLADQLLVPMGLARGGGFRTLSLSPHATANANVIEQFLGVKFATRKVGAGSPAVEVRCTNGSSRLQEGAWERPSLASGA